MRCRFARDSVRAICIVCFQGEKSPENEQLLQPT